MPNVRSFPRSFVPPDPDNSLSQEPHFIHTLPPDSPTPNLYSGKSNNVSDLIKTNLRKNVPSVRFPGLSPFTSYSRNRLASLRNYGLRLFGTLTGRRGTVSSGLRFLPTLLNAPLAEPGVIAPTEAATTGQ